MTNIDFQKLRYLLEDAGDGIVDLVRKMIADAREDAYHEGYNDGYQEGKKDATYGVGK